MVKRKRMIDEIRFRITKHDLERINWLIDNHPDQYNTVSSLLRSLINYEYRKLVDDNGSRKGK